MLDVHRRSVALALLLILCPAAMAADLPEHTRAAVAGVVRDTSGGVISGADVTLLNAQQVPQQATRTDAQGRFSFASVPRGNYLLVVRGRGFAEERRVLWVGRESTDNLAITLGLEAVRAQVTVTATPGQAEDTLSVAQPVNVLNSEKIEQRAKSVVAQVAEGSVGIHLQRTSPTLSGIYIRGLTGNKVNVFLDGVRFTTSAQRGGINTFLNLIDPANLEALEVLRGPNSAQYGSDALGGSLQFLSKLPSYSPDQPLHATYAMQFNSADAGFGSQLSLSYGARSFGLLGSIAGRRVNTLRTGGGVDSHSALTRFLGIPSDTLYDRLPGTAFTQYAGMFKLLWTPQNGTSLVLHYSRAQQDGGRRHDQLLGGDGNLIADLRNLMHDLFYLRFDQARAGWFDQLTAVYSYNAQREERVNQGGQGNPLATITHERERMKVHGGRLTVQKQLHPRLASQFGAEYYHERIAAPAFGLDPATQTTTLRRPRVPHNALYESGGVYGQANLEAVKKRLRLMGSVRYSAASYRARAVDSPVVGGQPLWPDDSLRVADWTGRAGVVLTPLEGLSLTAHFSRGFRAPHMTDLGTLGLTGSGFEVAAPDLVGLNATIGDSAAADAADTGRPVAQVKPETSWNYEFGVRYRRSRFETEFSFFVNDIYGSVEKQALILPPGAVGLTIGGETIVAQNPNGTVFVAPTSNPVLVRANFGDARIVGVEHDLEWKFAAHWSIATIFTWLRAENKENGLPPNIEGGTPAPDGWLRLRYAPSNRPFWLEPYLHAAARQSRLSSLDLADRRTGATRTRSQIASFFNRGARVRGLIGPGADGLPNTADDVLLATGETLAQVQDRVLGAGVNSAPLFTAVPGYAVWGLRGGINFGERHSLIFDFENITDKNYRGISWGVDAPGRSLALRYSARF
jgi:outer membrane receptor protein involved in Fe transport